MNDNLDQKLDVLFAAARATVRDTERAEFAFETRLAALTMHALRDAAGADLVFASDYGLPALLASALARRPLALKEARVSG